MEYPVMIQVDDDDSDCCHRDCPFLNRDYCNLFDVNLNEFQLPDGRVWQDGVNPLMERDFKCWMMHH